MLYPQYVDDVIARFLQLMDGADAAPDANGFATVAPLYTTTVGYLAQQMKSRTYAISFRTWVYSVLATLNACLQH